MNDTQLARPAAHGGAITRPQTTGYQYEGEEAEDSRLPRVHLFQGLGKEREIYGKGPASGGEDWKPGDLINALTQERVASRTFIPIFGWSEYIKFGRDSQGRQTTEIIYRTRSKSQVPPADLEWSGVRPNQIPPACTKFMNFALLFAGEDMPLVAAMKVSSIVSGQSLNGLEKARRNRGSGYYEFGTRPKRNSRGDWLIPSFRPLGDPPADLLETASILFNGMSAATVSVAIDAGDTIDEDQGGAGSGDSPSGATFDPGQL